MSLPRFKRVGPNAMKGRGIGTARGRATIMRGAFALQYMYTRHSLRLPILQPTVRFKSAYTSVLTLCSSLYFHLARRGRGVPAARGIRR